MARRPRDIGTQAETATRKLLQDYFPDADRSALRGARDEGDIIGTPGFVWEVKGGNTARTAGDALINAWLTQTAIELANSRWPDGIGVLVTVRAGYGKERAHKWWAWLPVSQYARIIGGEHIPSHRGDFTVRMELGELLILLGERGHTPTVPWVDDPTHPDYEYSEELVG